MLYISVGKLIKIGDVYIGKLTQGNRRHKKNNK